MSDRPMFLCGAGSNLELRREKAWRMKNYKRIRFKNNEKDFHNLGAGPMEIHGKPEMPDEATRTYREQR